MDRIARKDDEHDGADVHALLMLGQEAERKRVAEELHDDISQRLALVAFALHEIEQMLPPASPTLEDKLKAVRQNVESISADIHRISHNLHPSTVVHLGLVPALRRLCREFSEMTRIAVEFNSDSDVPLTSQEVAIALYRVAQEALTNVAKHSGSREARVTLAQRDGALHLAIADTGVGFDPKQRPVTAGLGLINIRERARMIGAAVQINSGATGGTTIGLRVPLEAVRPSDQIGSERFPPSGV
jgi:signal transduction histidine kinase